MILAVDRHSGLLLVWASRLKWHTPKPPTPMTPTLDGHSDRLLPGASHIPKGSKPGLATLMVPILAGHSGHLLPWASHIPWPSLSHRRHEPFARWPLRSSLLWASYMGQGSTTRRPNFMISALAGCSGHLLLLAIHISYGLNPRLPKFMIPLLAGHSDRLLPWASHIS